MTTHLRGRDDVVGGGSVWLTRLPSFPYGAVNGWCSDGDGMSYADGGSSSGFAISPSPSLLCMGRCSAAAAAEESDSAEDDDDKESDICGWEA